MNEIDYVEVAKYTDCDCGHALLHHRSDGRCRDMRTRRRPPIDLPEPVYVDGAEQDPFGSWPTNWPAPSEWVEVTEPCPCTHFYEAEPPEPDWGDER